ncbi:MAG: hypothetical protein ACHP65_03600 [Legionellales bacterium]
MAISILYDEDNDEIQFCCPNNNCPIQKQLITNLTKSGITFENKGAHILVKLAAFSSTEDIAEKALTDFIEIDNFKNYHHYDPTGTVMSFGYDRITPAAKEEALYALQQNRRAAMDRYKHDDCRKQIYGVPSPIDTILSKIDGITRQIEALKENSKDLLDAHYSSLRASAHHS